MKKLNINTKCIPYWRYKNMFIIEILFGKQYNLASDVSFLVQFNVAGIHYYVQIVFKDYNLFKVFENRSFVIYDGGNISSGKEIDIHKL